MSPPSRCLRESDDIPEGEFGAQNPVPDIRYFGYNAFIFDGCEAGWGYEFAVTGWERQSHIFPGDWQVEIDTNLNGIMDHFVYTFDLGFVLNGSLSGQSGVFVDAFDDVSGEYLGTTVFFFTISPTNYATSILTICGDQLGFEDTSAVGLPMAAQAVSFDGYYGGGIQDIESDMVISPLGHRYEGLFYFEEGDFYSPLNTLEYRDRSDLFIVDYGEDLAVASDIGVLLVTFSGREGREALPVFVEGHPDGFVETPVVEPEPIEGYPAP